MSHVDNKISETNFLSLIEPFATLRTGVASSTSFCALTPFSSTRVPFNFFATYYLISSKKNKIHWKCASVYSLDCEVQTKKRISLFLVKHALVMVIHMHLFSITFLSFQVEKKTYIYIYNITIFTYNSFIA